jgi:hypothetical protein
LQQVLIDLLIQYRLMHLLRLLPQQLVLLQLRLQPLVRLLLVLQQLEMLRQLPFLLKLKSEPFLLEIIKLLDQQSYQFLTKLRRHHPMKTS